MLPGEQCWCISMFNGYVISALLQSTEGKLISRKKPGQRTFPDWTGYWQCLIWESHTQMQPQLLSTPPSPFPPRLSFSRFRRRGFFCFVLRQWLFLFNMNLWSRLTQWTNACPLFWCRIYSRRGCVRIEEARKIKGRAKEMGVKSQSILSKKM